MSGENSCALDSDFASATLGKESWTQVTSSADTISDTVMQGLDNPVWRQTTLVETGELIESTPWPPQGLIPEIPDGPKDIKTTVWYGQTMATPRPKLRKNLLKGIQTAAAVFLLEAMVLMSATSQWSGSWTQTLYGTGQADVWEVFGKDNLTNVSWRQGWRPLEPLQESKFGNSSFMEYVSNTLEERAPRLVVMECPAKHWYNSTKALPRTKNAARQAEKKLREAMTPFLETAHEISEKQCHADHDFLLEAPLTCQVLNHPIVKQMTADERVCVVNGKSWNNGRPAWWMTSAHEMAQQLEKNNAIKNPVRMIKNVMVGFGGRLHHKEPERIKSLVRSLDMRIRGAGMYADTHMVNLAEALNRSLGVAPSIDQEAYAVIDEKTPVPEAGIEFDIPPEMHAKIPKSLLSSIRRLHFNSGHPPNDELERIVRLSGGSELARAAVKGIKCTVCRKAAPTRTPKPAKAKMNIGQFNDTVQIDLGYEKDSEGKTHGWAVMVDEGTDWCVVKYLGNGKTAGELYRILEEGWIDWAGPPDVLVADSERGFIAEEFAFKLGKAGTLFTPAAGYAPWQKGKVERKIKTICSIIRKTVLHLGLKGPEDMKLAGVEAAAAVNHRPGPSGVSPGMMLFGQRLKMYGELYADGEPAYHHLDGNDPSTELGRRLQIRCSSRQATEAHYAKEMVRKTVAARTRLVEKVDVGDLVFFYRCYPSAKAQKLQAQRGCYLGPGVVIGHQKTNAWISYAGRCYLVAPEHIRSMAPDEVCSTKPLIRQGLEELRKASKSQDYIDITGQQATSSELEQAVNSPAGDDHSAPVEEVVMPPAEEHDSTAAPIQTLEQPDEEMNTEVEALQQEVEQHVEEPQNSTAESSGEKRKGDTSESTAGEDEEESPRPPPAPISWKPQGAKDNMKWKKQKKDEAFVAGGKRILTAKIKKKMLDKEIPYHEIPVQDRKLYEKAEEKEWKDWLDNKSVRIVKGKEVADVYKYTDPSRIINTRFVYRDKNASIRTPQTWLPIKAKARICAQGFSEPLAKAGLVKLDSPTVQRVGIMVFLQLVANFEWFDTWRKGDISSAFLQGTERGESKGKLYLRPPKDRPLAGVSWGDLLEVLKSVYGLPDAPRAWWEEVTGFLRDLGFQHSRMDVAFMVLYHDTGDIGGMIVLHVDDIMVATDGSKFMEGQVEKFHAKYPFGEWEYVSTKGEIAYTGRQISLHGNEIHMGQADFINGRMDEVPFKREKNRSPESACNPTEHAEFRSGVGNLHWATSQTRVDHAVDTSRLQKRQNAPTHQDYKDLVKVVKEVKDTADVVVKIRPIKNMVVGAFTDSSLYGSQGELIPDDDALEGYDKHKLHSQGGSLIVVMDRNHLDDLGDIPFSFGDWRTRASRRVLHSTFAAEAQAGVETYGLAKYYRAYMCDILFGYADWKDLDKYGESEMPIILFTDCKSLYDNLKKEGSVPDDKWVAVPVASLRGAVSAGPGRDERKSECRWVPSRWQLADCLTKKGLSEAFRERMASGTTRLHEPSLQSVKRKKTAAAKGNTNFTWLCYGNTPRGSEPRSDYDSDVNDDTQCSYETPPFHVKPLSACMEFLPGTSPSAAEPVDWSSNPLQVACSGDFLTMGKHRKKKHSDKRRRSPASEEHERVPDTPPPRVIEALANALDDEDPYEVSRFLSSTGMELEKPDPFQEFLDDDDPSRRGTVAKSSGASSSSKPEPKPFVSASGKVFQPKGVGRKMEEFRDKWQAEVAGKSSSDFVREKDKSEKSEDSETQLENSESEEANPGVRNVRVKMDKAEKERERKFHEKRRLYDANLDEILQKEGMDYIESEPEQRLIAFNSHHDWGSARNAESQDYSEHGITLTCLPVQLEFYVLRTDARLRLLFKSAYEEYRGANFMIKIFKMPEWTYRNKRVDMLWIGLIVFPANYVPDQQDFERQHFDLLAFHGTVLSQARMYVFHPEVPIARGPRHKASDNLSPLESYCANFYTGVTYVEMQKFAKRQSEAADLEVICVVGITAEEIRNSKGYKGRIMMAKNATPKIVMLRPDDEQVTLRKIDRCMSDYQYDNVPNTLEVASSCSRHEASRKNEATRKQHKFDPLPWRKGHKLVDREADPEIVANSIAMEAIPNPEQFLSYAGQSLTNEDVRKAEKEEFEMQEMDEEGWPVGRYSCRVGPCWWYEQWEDYKLAQVEIHGEETELALDVPGRPKSEIAFTLNRRNIPSKHVKPDLLSALRKLRAHEDDEDGEPITPRHKMFKDFDLHQMADALRRASPGMHTHLLRVFHNNYGRRRLQLQQEMLNSNTEGLTEDQKNTRSGVNDEKAREIVELLHKQGICKELIKDHNTHNHEEFMCPVYLGHIRAGWNKHEARVALKERVYAGLNNLYRQQERGDALLETRESQYLHSSTRPVENVEAIQWSDDEAEFEVEDDIEQGPNWKPSKAWTARHYEMQEAGGEWDTEEQRTQESRLAAARGEGRFSEMDKRYHNCWNQKDDTLLKRHEQRTQGRKVCQYYTTKAWCKYGFDCTMRHIEQSDETYRHFSSMITGSGKGKKGKGKGKSKSKGKGKGRPYVNDRWSDTKRRRI